MKYITTHFREKAYATLVLLLLVVYASVFFHRIDELLLGEKLITDIVINTSLFLSGCVLLINIKKIFLSLLSSSGNLFLFFLLSYTFIAIFWGQSVNLGFESWSKIGIPVLLITAMYQRDHSRKAIRVGHVYFFVFIAVLNIIFSLTLPKYGTGTHDPSSWNGVFFDRNYASFFTVLALAYFLYSFLFIRRKKIFNFLMSFLCLIYIFKSGSATGLISTTIVLALVFIVPAISREKRFFLPFAIISILFFTASLVSSVYLKSAILDALNKDETMTGRSNLWAYSWQAIKEKPLLGYGAQRVVIGNDAVVVPSDSDLTDTKRFNEIETHNTYLSYAINFGALGFLMFMIAHFITFMGLVRALYSNPHGDRWSNLNVIFFAIVLIFQFTLEMYGFLGFWLVFTYLYHSAVHNKPFA